MEHIGIDLGGRESQVCVRSPGGEIVEERRLATAALGTFLEARPPARVILEACTESMPIADAARALGHDVRIVASQLVRSLGVGARRTKTDRRDAQALSAASCRLELPSIHLPSVTAREHRTLCGTREALVGARTQLVNTVRGWLRQHGRTLPRGYVYAFPQRVRAACPAPLPPAIERQLVTIEQLTVQVRAADRDVALAAEAMDVCRHLTTVPGIGPTTALRYVAALDTVTRFASAHAVEAYLGLTPGEQSSSGRQRRLGITKAGPRAVRSLLVQAAWAARRAAPNDPLIRWARAVERRRGRKTATVALARKLAGILYALWRDQTDYTPIRSARSVL